jgi:hypothetical protein
LTNDDVQRAAIEAVKYYVEFEKTTRKRAILHNTEEILKHYISFVDSVESIETEDMFIKSFTESKTVTEALLRHVNRCFDKLEERYPIQFNTLAYLYLDGELAKVEWCERIEITAIKMNTSESTVRRWRKEMVQELSALIFGAETLKLWTI